MIWLFVATALGADFTATLDGAPWAPRTVLAAPDPAHPWNFAMLISDGSFTCADLASGKASRSVSTSTTNENGETKTTRTVEGAADDTRFTAVFASTKPGATAPFVLPSGVQGADLKLDTFAITLVSAPAAAGPGGKVDIDWKGPTFVGKGELAFDLCAPFGERPLPTWPSEARDHELVNAGMFDDAAEKKLAVKMALPDWTYEAPAKESYRFEARWTAPDGMTRLGISLEPPPEDFKKEAAASAKDTLKMYADMGAKELRNEAVGAGARVFELEQGGGRQLVVLRYDKGWSYLVKCTVVSDPDGAAAVFDAAVAACTGIKAK